MTEIDLSSTDVELLCALLRGESHAQAASSCGLSERTVRRRVSTVAFKSALRAARDEMFRRTADALAEAALESVRTLSIMVRDSNVSPPVRRAAARDLLALSLRVRDQFELVERIEHLENRLLEDSP